MDNFVDNFIDKFVANFRDSLWTIISWTVSGTISGTISGIVSWLIGGPFSGQFLGQFGGQLRTQFLKTIWKTIFKTILGHNLTKLLVFLPFFHHGFWLVPLWLESSPPWLPKTCSDKFRLDFFCSTVTFPCPEKGEICFYQNNERAFAQSILKEETV